MARIATALCLTFFFAVSLFAAPSTSSPTPVPAGPSKQQQSLGHFQKGLEHRDKAWEYEEKAAKASNDKDREKNLAKAQKEYQQAVKEQIQATFKDPKLYQAYSSLGYASRKLGQYDAALTAYDKALAIEPNYTEAIEYRGEAYLGLNRVAEAQEAYELLFKRDPERAAQLLRAFSAWIAEREGYDPVRAWIEQKQQIAQEMGGAKGDKPGDW